MCVMLVVRFLLILCLLCCSVTFKYVMCFMCCCMLCFMLFCVISFSYVVELSLLFCLSLFVFAPDIQQFVLCLLMLRSLCFIAV